MKKSLSKNFLFVAGLSIISFMLIMAIFAPILSPFSPYDIQLENRFLSPNAINWFGTDENGSDIFSKVLFGARISLMVALCVVGINCFVGLVRLELVKLNILFCSTFSTLVVLVASYIL